MLLPIAIPKNVFSMYMHKSYCESDKVIFGQCSLLPLTLTIYSTNTIGTKYMSMMYVCKQIQAKKRPSIILLTYPNDTMIVF